MEQIKSELSVTRVYNADQSGICFDYLPKRTINSSDEKTVWVRCNGKDNERFTGMYLADSEGNQSAVFVLKTVPSKDSDTAQENSTARRGFGTRLWGDQRALKHDRRADLRQQMRVVEFQIKREVSRLSLCKTPDRRARAASSRRFFCALDRRCCCSRSRLERVPAQSPLGSPVCQLTGVAWFSPLKGRLREEWVQFLMHQLRFTTSLRLELHFDSSHRRDRMRSLGHARRGPSWDQCCKN